MKASVCADNNNTQTDRQTDRQGGLHGVLKRKRERVLDRVLGRNWSIQFYFVLSFFLFYSSIHLSSVSP